MIRPLKNRISVECFEPSETESGIYLPPSEHDTTRTGRVLNIGPDVRDIKAGDLILFSKRSSVTIDDNILMITDKDILCLKAA